MNEGAHCDQSSVFWDLTNDVGNLAYVYIHTSVW